MEFISAATSTTVSRSRCSAAGCSAITWAAWASFVEACSSPSDCDDPGVSLAFGFRLT